MNYKEKILENRKKGYNCAQAVACAFCNAFGVEEKEAFRAMEGFGGGMGVMGTCGAVSAMTYLAGLSNSDGNLDEPKSKGGTTKLSRIMHDKFKEKNGSVICREIKGVDTGIVLRSCQGCVEDAGEIVEEVLLSK